MYRRSIHRGVAALAIVALMTLAVAQPAAAAPRTGALNRLAHFWPADAAASLWNRLTVWLEGQPAKTPRTGAKKGWGIDPNGNRVYIEDPAPDPGNPDTSS